MTNGPPRIFDRPAYRARRARAAREGGDAFLAREAADGLRERLAAVNRRFARGLYLGGRAETYDVFAPFAQSWVQAGPARTRGLSTIADEEHLPFAPESFDLVVSVLALHAVNDLPGALLQIRQVLKPDGLFLAALFGGETLNELRTALTAAEAEVTGGAGPRVAPFADVGDLGGLLQRAGFALPVADAERTRVRYRSLMTLFKDLRSLGETNVLAERVRKPLSRRMLATLAARYAERYADEEGRLKASFEVVSLTGWAPHESQRKPLAPGSAKNRLADALGTTERRAGEKADPRKT